MLGSICASRGETLSVLMTASSQFDCCGYFNRTTPAFVTDDTCPSPAAAALVRGCATAISSFANIFIDNIFTAVFGMVGTFCPPSAHKPLAETPSP